MSLSSLPEAPPRPEFEPPVRRRRRRSRWSRFKRWVRRQRRQPSRAALGGLGLVVLLLLLCGWRVASAQKALRNAEQSFLEAKEAIAETRTDDAAVALASAQGSLDGARSHATGFPLGLTRSMPLIGSAAEAVVDVAAAGTELVAAGNAINDAAASFPTSGQVGIDGHDLSEFHDAAVASEEALQTARRHTSRAAEIIDGPAGALLPIVSRPARRAASTIDSSMDQVDGAERGLKLLADLTGPAARSRLLILSQDTMEVRPTGGYIGSYGVLEFNGGHVDLTEYAATEDLPNPEPPVEAPRDLAGALPDAWGLSNANWWPNFPTSAAAAQDLFARQRGLEVDGVVAITEDLLEALVTELGPFVVPGYDQPVTGEDFAGRILYEVELKRPLDVPRKRFIIELSELVIKRLFTLEASELPAVVRAFAGAGGDAVQVWFEDSARQALIDGTSWSGALPAVTSDFLLLTDANLTAGKASRDLVRDATYNVVRDGDGLVGELSVIYRNEGERSGINPYYNGLLRVYVPHGSELLDESEGQRVDGPAPDGPYDVFSRSILVEPGEEIRVDFAYRLPKNISQDGYRLTWVRQAGTPNDVLRAVSADQQRVSPEGGSSFTFAPDLSGDTVREFLRSRWLIRKILD